ncbi:MAG: dihydropteroate synthase [Chloroflexota bacterium]
MWNPRVLVIDSPGQLEAEMAAVGVDPIGAEIMLPKGVFRAVKIEGLRTPAANIIKQEMLAKGGEAATSWSSVVSTGETTDVLLLGTLRQYRRLISRLGMQPFGLRSLAEALKEAIERFDSVPRSTLCGGLTLEWGKRTYVMGIINATFDSFSGDGLGTDVEAAVAQARRFVEEGADLLDVGGESTRPGHIPIEADEELRRILPVLKAVIASVDVPVSIDTYKAEVAEAAIAEGADMVNDIWGLHKDPRLATVVAQAAVPVVIMHNQDGTEYHDLMADITRSLRESVELALNAGVAEANIIVDPGIGFGKRREHNLEVLARLAELRVLGRPILLGTSRKSTIGYVLNLPPDQRVEGTAATVAIGIANGADIVRVHDVKEMVRVARMSDAIARGRWQEYS